MIHLQVRNMSCGDCVRSVTRAVQAVDTGATVQVDIASGTVGIEGSRDPAAYAAALEQAGFPAVQAANAAVKARTGCCCG